MQSLISNTLGKDTNIGSLSQYQQDLIVEALEPFINRGLSILKEAASHLYWCEDKSGNIPNIGVTRDYVVLFNPSFLDELCVAELQFILFHLIEHALGQHWQRQYGFETEIWDRAVDCEINSATLMVTEIRPPYRTAFLYDNIMRGNDNDHIRGDWKTVGGVSDRQERFVKYDEVDVLQAPIPERGTYCTAEFIYQAFELIKYNRFPKSTHRWGRSEADEWVVPTYDNWDTPLDATSNEWVDKTNALKDVSNAPETHISYGEHCRILSDVLDAISDHGQGNWGHLCVPLDGKNDNHNPLQINWDNIIKDVEAIASGNKQGGMHDFSMSIPSKRDLDNFVLPSMVGGKSSKICVIIDNSSSVDMQDLIAAWKQIDAILALGLPSVDVIYCDTTGTLYEDISDTKDLPILRGGGTNMVNGLRMAFENDKTYDMIVIISDGDTPYPDMDEFPANRYMFIVVQNSCTRPDVIPDHIPHRLIRSIINPHDPEVN